VQESRTSIIVLSLIEKISMANIYLIEIFDSLSCMSWWQVFNITYAFNFLCMHEGKSGSTFLYQNVRERCREGQRSVGTIQGFEAPEPEVAGDARIRGGRKGGKSI
jgi:hypothetical protein